MTDFRVALIGYGHAGAIFHAPLIGATPGLRLTAIVTRDPGRQSHARRDWPGAAILDTAEALWTRARDLDLVVVAAPNRAHVPLADAALSARLPVVIDKPLAPGAGDARGLAGRFAREGILLTVFQNRRWDGDFLTLQRLLREQRLGVVHRFESRFERWRPELRGVWRERAEPAEGGGLLLDLGSHLVDQAIGLFGPPTRVYAEIDRRRDARGADDDTFVALTHASGVRSHLWMSALSAQPGPRFRVLGSDGTFTKHGLDVQEDQLRAGTRPGDPGWGEDPPERCGELAGRGASASIPTLRGSYETFYAQVARALRGEQAPPVDPASSVAVLEAIEAARRSSRDGVVAMV